ncbi:hypothetical protein [Magnetospirillum fulvum]|uniref:Uncharacterized protein n=1 Tax=Magnetospirillum fulvum MGU-K5 TaxID=1316936 RepID=S9SC46_MAGFU|nr:hypothetical protein [Magnetospirillum fulvum]EPY03477.1 hypothetical protein K678_00160 [Magnetospirillum fulvum MGU-K5]
MDWKKIVGTVAPSIATALGGPLSGLATKAIARAFGLGDDSEDSVAAAVTSATPEQLLALKKADQDFAVKMRELDIDLERIAAGDRDSARKREVDAKDWTPKVLAFVIVGGFFGTVAYVLGWGLSGMDAAAAAFAGSLVGYVSAKAEQVVAYYFGSSSGADKAAVLLSKAGPVK